MAVRPAHEQMHHTALALKGARAIIARPCGSDRTGRADGAASTAPLRGSAQPLENHRLPALMQGHVSDRALRRCKFEGSIDDGQEKAAA